MKSAPQIFYGLHMVEGVAEYTRSKTKENYRLFIGEEVIKAMDPTFAGKPVFLEHVNEVNLETLEHDADGYVVESFYNPNDGKHWAKFIVLTDEAKDAIKSGFVLSNCYDIDGKGAGGKWHNVDYEYEVTRGTYEHLAIVNRPRYNESVILTPEQFKAYNEEKQAQLEKLKNSKDEETNETKEKETGMKFFKKEKATNSAELASMTVVLEKSGKEVSIERLLNEADDEAMNGRKANGDDKVDCGGKAMTVNDLIKRNAELEEASKKHEEEKKNFPRHERRGGGEIGFGLDVVGFKRSCPTPKKEDDNARKDNAKDGEVEADKKEDEKKSENESEEKDEKKENEDKEESKKANALHFEALKNAENAATIQNGTIDLPQDKVSRGKARYGSK